MTEVRETLQRSLGGAYRVERELGAGGMATVYLAHDIRHERDVAIKVLHPDLGAALGGERFLSEIRTTARLQHPHILPLLDSGSANGLLFYVMPLVTGETLRSRLQREMQLPVDDLTTAITAVNTPDKISAWAFRARGLAYASLGQSDNAVADYNQYLSLTPNAPDKDQVTAWIADLTS